MSRILTGNRMISSVRKRTMTPDDTSIFTDQDILDIVNEEMDVQILEKLLTLHEEHLTTHIDIPRNNEGIYEIPYRAIGNKIRDISLVNGTGRNAYIYELSQVGIGELPDYSFSIDSSVYIDRFYVEGNEIKLINPSRNYDKVRIYFYMRPSVLTKLDQAGIVSSITDDGTNVTFGLSQVGKSFTLNELYDFVGKRSPNDIIGFDLKPQTISTGLTGNVVFKLEDVQEFLSDIKVGDYLTIAEQTPVPNIPTELHPVLAQASAIHILEALGDTEALNNAEKRMIKMTNSVQTLIDDRVELAPKKIKPRHGTLSQAIGTNRKYRGSY